MNKQIIMPKRGLLLAAAIAGTLGVLVTAACVGGWKSAAVVLLASFCVFAKILW